MAENELLVKPLTEIEKAELFRAATEPDSHLSKAGVLLLRRALFQLDQKDVEIERLRWLVSGYQTIARESILAVGVHAAELCCDPDHDVALVASLELLRRNLVAAYHSVESEEKGSNRGTVA